MTESKDPSDPNEPNEPNEPNDPFASGRTPPGWTQPGQGQSWEYQQPPQWSQPSGPIGPPQEQIPPEGGVPPHWQQPYGQPPGQQWGAPGPQYEKPPNHLVWAILSTILCCLPLGIASIVFANRVNSRWNAGDVAGAREASDKAMKFAIASAVLGVLGSIVIISMGGLEA